MTLVGPKLIYPRISYKISLQVIIKNKLHGKTFVNQILVTNWLIENFLPLRKFYETAKHKNKQNAKIKAIWQHCRRVNLYNLKIDQQKLESLPYHNNQIKRSKTITHNTKIHGNNEQCRRVETQHWFKDKRNLKSKLLNKTISQR